MPAVSHLKKRPKPIPPPEVPPASPGEEATAARDRVIAQTSEMNATLLIAGLHQHELREEADRLNARLRREIAQRERTEARLQISETRFRRLFEAAQDGILMLDAASRRVTDANPFMTTLLGYTRAELVGKELWEIGLLADEALSKAAFRALQEHGIVRYEDLPLQTKQGRSLEVEFVSNLYEEDGHQVIQCNIRDITDRKRLVRDGEAARLAAERANSAKDDFLAALSHELRTPLNPVLLLATEAAANPALPAELRADFEIIAKNVLLEARMIDDLLDSTRIARGKLVLDLQPLAVNDTMKEAIAHVQSDIEGKGLVLALAFDPENPIVNGDPMRLQQVFWNVLRNAVKFTPAGGRIFVRTAVDPAAGRVLVEVVDTGPGMTAVEMGRIFDAFQQGDHAARGSTHRFGGLGLGLAISRTLVELHAGTIRAASAGLGSGSCFTIELPLARRAGCEPATTLTSPAAVGVSPTRPVRARILLVEDHTPTRIALQRLLLARRHEVSAAATLTEARRLGTAQPFDLLITDIGLPDGSGYELMEELGRLRGIRGIVMTGYGMDEDIEHSRRAGFSAHLTKPVRIQTLDAALGIALASSRLSAED